MTGLLRASSGKTDYFDRKRKFSRHNFPVANFCLKFADENPSLTERRTTNQNTLDYKYLFHLHKRRKSIFNRQLPET